MPGLRTSKPSGAVGTKVDAAGACAINVAAHNAQPAIAATDTGVSPARLAMFTSPTSMPTLLQQFRRRLPLRIAAHAACVADEVTLSLGAGIVQELPLEPGHRGDAKRTTIVL